MKKRGKKLNLNKYHIILFISSIFLAVILVNNFFIQEEVFLSPEYESLYGEHSATIYRDIHGVPHVSSETEEGLFYGSGYAMAQDIVKTMTLHVRAVLGNSSMIHTIEVPNQYGLIGRDIPPRLLEVAEFEKDRYENHITTAGKIRLNSFTAGVNQHINENQENMPWWVNEFEPYELLALSNDLVRHYGSAIKRLKEAGHDVNYEDYLTLESNMFAVSGSRTDTGNTMFYAEPHQGYETDRYQIQLTLDNEDGFSVYCLSTPGPVNGCSNKNVAGGGTNNGANIFDVYEETIRPNNENYNQYLYDGEWRDMVIKKKNITFWDDVLQDYQTNEYTFKYTHHGPIIYADDITNYERAYSLKSTASIPQGVLGLWGWKRENIAQIIERGESGAGFGYGRTNLMFADSAGDILYMSYGLYPKRNIIFEESDSDFYSKPIPGNTSATEWTETHNLVEDIPHLLNPETGYMQNCNNPPQYVTEFDANTGRPYIDKETNFAHLPNYILEEMPDGFGDRGRTSIDILASDDELTFEEIVEHGKSAIHLHANTIDLDEYYFGDEDFIYTGILDFILYAYDNFDWGGNPPADAVAVRELLGNWDGKLTKDSQAATFYELYESELTNQEVELGTLHRMEPEDLSIDGINALVQGLSETINLAETYWQEDSEEFPEYIPEWGELALLRTYGFAGDESDGTKTITHEYEMGHGYCYSAIKTKYIADPQENGYLVGSRYMNAGASYYKVIELNSSGGDPKMVVMQPIPQNENEGAKHHTYFPEKFANHEPIEVFFSLEKILEDPENNLDSDVEENPYTLTVDFGEEEAYCGDGTCNSGENYDNCPEDCDEDDDEDYINFSVSPTQIPLTIKQGDNEQFSFTIKNDETNSLSFVIDSNMEMLAFQENIVVGAGDSKTILVTAAIDEDLEPDIYLGKIGIKTGDYQKQISVTLEVITKDSLFDVSLNLSKENLSVLSGEGLEVEISLRRIVNLDSDEVDLIYEIKNENGEIVYLEEETKTIGEEETFTKTFNLPENLEEGEYVLYVQIDYGGNIASAHVWFSVILDETKKNYGLEILVLGVILTIIIVVVVLVKKKILNKNSNNQETKTLVKESL